VRIPQSVALQTGPMGVEFLVRGERTAAYLPHAPIPGFATLAVADGRNMLKADEVTGAGLWVAHGSVNGVAFGMTYAESSENAGRIVSTEFVARRGSQSVGFRQECAWIGPGGSVWLRDVRTVRVHPGSSAGSLIDLTIMLVAPDTEEAILDAVEAPFLAIRAARPLFPGGGGQFRNSLGEYEVEAVNGRSAAWCGCVGVVQGETVGFVVLDHPHNPFSPTPWLASEEGLFSPSPFLRHRIALAPAESLSFRYRLQTHRGYVDQGWANARLAEFAREPLRP